MADKKTKGKTIQEHYKDDICVKAIVDSEVQQIFDRTNPYASSNGVKPPSLIRIALLHGYKLGYAVARIHFKRRNK